MSCLSDKKPKSIVLFSGGLDSLLTVRVLQRQGIEVVGLTIHTPFHDCEQQAREKAVYLGIRLVVKHTDQDYLDMIAAPRFGYGKALNPCIDCRIMMCEFAKKLMEEEQADFVASGEIAGQRPNSQKQHQLVLIARESGLGGLLVRPLSAKVLAPSTPENTGILQRENLYGFTGRGRMQLHTLGRKLDVGKMPQPSTGCSLCEKSYAPRLSDLLEHGNRITDWDIAVLGSGRQIRISPKIKCAIGRNERHCKELQKIFEREDKRPCIMVVPKNFNGPTTLCIGPNPEEDSPEQFESFLDLAGALTLRFTNEKKYDPENALALFRFADERIERKIRPNPDLSEYVVIEE